MRPLSRIARLLWGGPRQHKGPPPARLNLADGPVYAVGDIHGCAALYRALEDRIRTVAAGMSGPARIVLLGDLVDRGPDTAGLLDYLARAADGPRRSILMGNHEEMMLAFLADPRQHRSWLEQGGFETLRSYGLALTPGDLRRLPVRRLQQILAAHLPETHLDLLRRALPLIEVEDGAQRFVLAHAGFDPARPVDRQDTRCLYWGQGGARPGPGDGLRLIHGHVIDTAPDLAASSFSVDSGAYRTGVLSAVALVSRQPPRLFHVRGSSS